MSSCRNQIKDCETEIDFVIGGYIAKLQVMDVGVNNPFKGHVWIKYERPWLEMVTIGRFVERMLSIGLKVVGKW